MLAYLRASWRCAVHYRGYEPSRLSPLSALHWVRQFPGHLRPHLLALLSHVVYVSKRQAVRTLVAENEKILRALAAAGTGSSSVVYVGTDDAGSSSHIMLNALRNAARLEQRGFKHYLNWSDQERLLKLIRLEPDIAIIYVDDFAGTGRQFCRSRDFFASHFPRPFPEFFLLVACCEEAAERLDDRAVSLRTGLMHRKSERPLHPDSHLLPEPVKAAMREFAISMHAKYGLGYQGLATMVVLFSNTPNTVPLIVRGSFGQDPIRGIFPRLNDLPAEGWRVDA